MPYQRCVLPKATKLTDFAGQPGVQSAEGRWNVHCSKRRSNTEPVLRPKGFQIPLDQFSELVASLQMGVLAGYQYHGELLVQSKDGILRGSRQWVLNSVLQGAEFPVNMSPLFVMWTWPDTQAVPGGKYSYPVRHAV